MPQESLFIADLKAALQSEVYDDEATLGMYATDASLYQITPVVVVLPKNESELLKAAFCQEGEVRAWQDRPSATP